MVIGEASAYPAGLSNSGVNQPGTLFTPTDVAGWGCGRGIECAAEILKNAGGPHYFTKTAMSTAGTVGPVAKKATGVASPTEAYGAILLPGADHNGDVLITAIAPGVSLTVVVGGAAAFTASGNAITLTVTTGTTGANVAALSLTAVAALIATPVAEGTGASVCGQTLALTPFDAGSIIYTPNGQGALLVAGADSNGGVLYVSKISGLQIAHVIAGNSTPLSIYVANNTITVNCATGGGGSIACTANAIVAALLANTAAMALLQSVTATGTGASNSAALAATAVNEVRVKHLITGTSTSLGVAVAQNGSTSTDLTVTLATNTNGEPTSTASAVLTAIAASAVATALVTPAEAGAGTGLAGALAFTVLTWGGSGALVVSGTPNDGYWSPQIVVARSGTVGSTTAPPTVIWSTDGLNFTGAQVIQSSGVLALTFGTLITGLTATFTGVLNAGDVFSFYVAGPSSTLSDLTAAVNAAYADPVRKFGVLVIATPLSRTNAAAIDAIVQAQLQSNPSRWLASTRDIGDGVQNETDTAWQTSVQGDFLGFVSATGFAQIGCAAGWHLSSYTNQVYKRPEVFFAAARLALVPIHENLGFTGRGPLTRLVAQPGTGQAGQPPCVTHDDGINPGMAGQRFRCFISYPQYPGGYFFGQLPVGGVSVGGGQTMADPSQGNYLVAEWVAILLAAVRLGQIAAFPELNDSLAYSPVALNGAPAGAILPAEAARLNSLLSAPIREYLEKIKSDGKGSVSPLPPGAQYAQVDLTYNYAATKQLRFAVQATPRGLSGSIVMNVGLNVPQ